MKQFLRDCIYALTRKRVDEASLVSCEIKLRRQELSFFNLSTNAVLSFMYEGALWYFRECPKILAAEIYWQTAIENFFESLDRLHISKEHFSQKIPITLEFGELETAFFHEYIASHQKDKSFRKALANVDRIARSVRFSIWEKQTYDCSFFEAFALDDLPESCYNIAVYFLWNMRAAAANYRQQYIVHGKYHSFFAATKAIASQIVAEELGLNRLITSSRWCRLTIEGGKTYFGVMSASAAGNRMLDRQITPNGSLQKELLDLHALDVITHQPDHGPNNYNVSIDGDQYRICAFDNDNPLTFFPFFSVRRSLAGCRPFVDDNGMVALPFLDEATAKALRCVDVKRLKKRLKPYLNDLQIAALIYRLKKVNQAIDKTQAHRRFLLESTAFNEETVRVELNGGYGVTYLSKSTTTQKSH